jgi:Ca2+-binding RTX toxin-like protein
VLVAAALAAVVLTGSAIADRAGGPERRDGVRTAPAAPVGTGADETVIGTTGADRLDGRGGDDVVLAGAGADVVSGSNGNDVLHGGPGDDVLWAGPGRDVLLGADGDDELRAANVDGQVDRLHCGAGSDTAWVVAVDGRTEDRTFGCERVVVVEVTRVRGGARPR